jgi:hypothetical protein
LCFAHRVKVDAMNALVSARPLQPAQQDLGSARVCDRLLPQRALDVSVARRSVPATCCAGASCTSRRGSTRAGVPPSA